MANEVAVASLKSKALYSDLNRNFGQGGAADIVLDKQAISQALFNIFRTNIGEAGPIFLPDFGSMLPYLLQEPLDVQTAFKLKAASIQAAQKWETRIDVDVGQSIVAIDYSLPGYLVRLVYTIRQTGEVASTNIPLSIRNSDGTTFTPESTALPTWYPTVMRNLELWFDGSDSKSVVQSISSLSKWKDKSGKNNHVSVSAGAPSDAFSLKQGAINGLPAMYVLDKGSIPLNSLNEISQNPPRLLLTRPFRVGARLHLFVVVRNPNAGFDGEDLLGVNFLRQLSAPFNTVLGVNLGLSTMFRRPETYVQTTTSPSKNVVMETSLLNSNEPLFLEVQYGYGDGITLFLNGAAVAGPSSETFSNVDIDILLESFGNIIASAGYLIGEILLINGNEVIPPEDVNQTRNYLRSKWMNTSVVTTVPVITPSVKSDVFITSSWLPQSTTATKDLKIVIQHTRTSPSQTVQFRITAIGPGINNGAKKTVYGSLIRYDGATPIQNNPLVANHAMVNYSDPELIGPFVTPAFWLELLEFGLIFTSKASNADHTDIIVSFPTGVDPAYPKVTFSAVTLKVEMIGSSLSKPASTTFSLS